MKYIIRFRHLISDQCFVYWTFVVLLMLPNVLMWFTESTGLLTRCVQLVLPLAFYLWALTLSRRPGRMFWWLFLLVFIGAFQIVLLYLYGESPIAVDMFLNVLTTNPTEANELLEQLWPSVVFVVVVYGGCIALSVLSLRGGLLPEAFCRRQRLVAALLAVVGVALLGADYATDRRFALRNDVFPVNGVYNMALAVERAGISARYPSTSGAFRYHAVSERPDSLPEIYVMVIGETLRADDLGLYGYRRATTPHLTERRAEMAVYRDALTMSNTTHKSVPLLLTSIAGEGSFDSLYTHRGLISAFSEAGYRTAFYTNQRRNGSFIDHLGEEAEDVVFAKDALPMSANQLDTVLVSLVDCRLTQYHGEKLLLVVHCYGSHFDYRDRYPRHCAAFGPVDYPSADRRHREQLINAYDNTVVFADEVVSRFIARLDSCGVASALLFTSDHGEDIFDDARCRFLHASPLPTYYQLRVPLLVWASESYRAAHPEKWSALRAHEDMPVMTNMVAFHTLCDLAGLSLPLLRPDLALGNAAYCAPPRRLYVNDHNEFLPIDSCGLKPLDIKQFADKGLAWP